GFSIALRRSLFGLGPLVRSLYAVSSPLRISPFGPTQPPAFPIPPRQREASIAAQRPAMHDASFPHSCVIWAIRRPSSVKTAFGIGIPPITTGGAPVPGSLSSKERTAHPLPRLGRSVPASVENSPGRKESAKFGLEATSSQLTCWLLNGVDM